MIICYLPPIKGTRKLRWFKWHMGMFLYVWWIGVYTIIYTYDCKYLFFSPTCQQIPILTLTFSMRSRYNQHAWHAFSFQTPDKMSTNLFQYFQLVFPKFTTGQDWIIWNHLFSDPIKKNHPKTPRLSETVRGKRHLHSNRIRSSLPPDPNSRRGRFCARPPWSAPGGLVAWGRARLRWQLNTSTHQLWLSVITNQEVNHSWYILIYQLG